jgi:hypothetical protein
MTDIDACAIWSMKDAAFAIDSVRLFTRTA